MVATIKGLIAALACDNYPSSPLHACAEDAAQVVELCRKKGWEGPARVHLNDQATNAMLKEALDWFVKEVNTGKYTNAIFVLSGHGTSIPAPGRADPTRELWCPYDIDGLWQSRELVTDEYYEEVLNGINKNLARHTKVLFEALCCNSGGLTTTQIDDVAAAVQRDPTVRARYLRNPWEGMIAEYRAGLAPVTREWHVAANNLFIDDDSAWAYRAAARSDQYSHELTSPTYGRGDVSRLAETFLYSQQGSITLRQLLAEQQAFIDKNYQLDQCPQLWAPTWMLDEDFYDAPAK